MAGRKLSMFMLKSIVSRVVGRRVRSVCPDSVWYADRASVSSRCYDGEVVVTVKTSVLGRPATLRLILVDGKIYARSDPHSMFDALIDYLDLGEYVGRMVKI